VIDLQKHAEAVLGAAGYGKISTKAMLRIYPAILTSLAALHDEAARGMQDATDKVALTKEPTGYMSDRERSYCRDHAQEIADAIRAIDPATLRSAV